MSRVNHADYEKFYKSYPWVVKGSVKNRDGKLFCQIKCVDTGKLRTIKVQDAFQVKRTEDAQKKFRRAQDRKAAKSKRAAKSKNR